MKLPVNPFWQSIMPLLILSCSVVVSGCTRETETVRTERTIEEPGTAVTSQYVERETVVEEDDDDDGSSTVLGTTFDVIGEVLALPFRLVAGIFRFIF